MNPTGQSSGLVTSDSDISPPPPKKYKVSLDLPQESHLSNLWDKKEYADVVFLVDDERVPAHKAILASKSEYFRGLLYGEMKEASMEEIPLPDVPLDAFKKVLQYAYTGIMNIEGSLESIMEVAVVADRFSFVDIKSSLGEQASEYISYETVLPLLVHSDAHHTPELHKKCLEFIEAERHTCKVLVSPSFLDLPEGNLISLISRDTFVAPELAIFRAVLHWKKHNQRSVEEMAEVVKCIRFGRLPSAQVIFTEIEPTGLFSESSILMGLRVLCKPIFKKIQPRGKVEPGKNLLNDPKILFESPASQIVKSRRSGHASDHNVVYFGGCYDTAGIDQRQRGEATLTLENTYLVNCLCFEAYSNVPNHPQFRKKNYSYTVSVSRDKSKWLQLFDYSTFACRGRQELTFPTLDVRYIQVHMKLKDGNQWALKFSSCQFSEDQRPFKFCSKGIIAPMYDCEVAIIPSSKTVHNHQICEAYFNQPYSATTIKFELHCMDTSVSKVDITVFLAVKANQKEGRIVKNLEKIPLKESICVPVKEMVIGYLQVSITKIHEKPTSPTRDSSQGQPQRPPAQSSPTFSITNVLCRCNATDDST